MPHIYFPSDKYQLAVDPERCPASVHERGMGVSRSYQCQRKGKYLEEGHYWCKQHLLSAVKAKAAARTAKYNAKADARVDKWEREAAEREVLCWSSEYLQNNRLQDLIKE